MSFKKILCISLMFILGMFSKNIIIFKEPILLYFIYILCFNERYYIFGGSCIPFFYINLNLFLKNCILFLLFEIVLIMLASSRNINKTAKYRMFMLTFFCYLVLINIFEPMVYNYIRLLKSLYLYIVIFVFSKIFIFSNK